ncbi:hypothetical protein M1394_00210 [Candidatus Marsarchaeota archaeon]|nr:hypothetical protein [Candidatus Marsarchaeota archaeon]
MTVSKWKSSFSETIVSSSKFMAYMLAREINGAIQKAGIIEKIGMKFAGGILERRMAPYIAAVVVLAFASKEISTENVERLINAIGVSPNKRLLKFVASLNLKNNFVCIPAIYFIKLVEKEPTPQMIIDVVSSLGMISDIQSARHVLDIYSEFLEHEGGKVNNAAEEDLVIKFSGPINRLSSLISKILFFELQRTFEDRYIIANIERAVPYLSALGVLIFTGRDTGEGDEIIKGLSDIVKSVGIILDEDMLNHIKGMEYGKATSIVYVPSIYLITSAGKQPTLDLLIKVISALSIKPDEAVAGYVLTIYQESAKGQ